MKATLHSDGGARGNPGPAGVGYVLRIKGRKPIKYAQYIGKATNNQAEYIALARGIERAVAEDVRELTCYLDSELVVQQLKGAYRVKDTKLRSLFAQVQRMLDHFHEITFVHVPREKNIVADRLVNKALDEAARE